MMTENISAQQLRQQIRSGQWGEPTSGAASGYVQANLVMLPLHEAFNFLLFCTRNSKPCPVLDVLEVVRVADGMSYQLPFERRY